MVNITGGILGMEFLTFWKIMNSRKKKKRKKKRFIKKFHLLSEKEEKLENIISLYAVRYLPISRYYIKEQETFYGKFSFLHNAEKL